jgi:flagellar hook protein FlgE
MSLFSALTASVSGMNAQASSLATISDDIANANTTGFKQATAQFEDMLSTVSASDFNAGGVSTVVTNGISSQGDLSSTTSSTDLAIQGNGFFVVQNSAGADLLTRAGSFTQNSSGTLVNTAGFTLMGQPITDGNQNTVIDGVDQLVPVTINPVALVANPSTSGTFGANLDSNAAIQTTNLPSANTASSTFTDKTSITAFDNQGNAVNLDVYFTKTGSNTWQVDVYNSADASTSGTTSFPYTHTDPTTGASVTDTPLSSETLNFNPTSGSLTSTLQGVAPGGAATNPANSLSVSIPNGQVLNINMSSMSQLASPFAVSNNTMNGNSPATFQSVSVSTGGIVSEVYSNGTTVPVFTIPLATVASVNSLTPVAGDAYQTNQESGSLVVGQANAGGFGSINGDNLELSTVDLATELTNMVVTQNSYSANSKVFEVGSELLQELSNLIK